MRTNLMGPGCVLAGFVFSLWLTFVSASEGQQCRGDLDGDGVITANDLAILLPLVAGTQDDEAPAAPAADVNEDGVVSAADIAALVQLQGVSCAPTPTDTASSGLSPTPTPQAGTPANTPTRSATPTWTRTPTMTPSRTITATPAPTCVVQAAHFGTSTGQLTTSDCVRPFGLGSRFADVYSIAGPLGQSIRVDVIPTGPAPTIVPFVEIVDPDGQFDRVADSPPIQFVVSSTRPYLISVTSDPDTAAQIGSYQLTLTALPCTAPMALTPGQAVTATLASTDCPDPGSPSVGGQSSPADRYTFLVTQAPMTVSIVMRQLSPADNLAPAFSVLGPDGVELLSQDEDFDCTPSGGSTACAEARFLALRPGTYTIIAAGGIGTYSLQLTTPVCHAAALNDIPADRPLSCPGQSGGCTGTLYGDPTRTACAAPLPIPDVSDSEPADADSPADLYTFTAAAGDVISVAMSSDDDAHLYLLGPAPTNALIAEDDNSGSISNTDAQLAATLPQAGTYTIVAANNNAVPADSPVAYTLLVQKCPVHGALDATTGRVLTDSFTSFDCFGFGGLPFRTYALTGTAGQFVTVSMTSDDVDASLRLLAPDGTITQNDDDLFDGATSDARASRILPVNGTYFVEVSSSEDSGPIDLGSAFSVQASTCATKPLTPGIVTDGFEAGDCRLPDGRRFDVFTFGPTGLPRAASLVPPSTGCAIALLGEGPQTPGNGCSSDMIEVPLSGNRSYGFIVAAADDTTEGPYALSFSSCPITSVRYGDTHSDTLAASDCADASGAVSDWYLVRAAATLVHFNAGISGAVQATFPASTVLSDVAGSVGTFGEFSDDPTDMIPLGGDLAALLHVAGFTAADGGAYVLQLDPASFRQ